MNDIKLQYLGRISAFFNSSTRHNEVYYKKRKLFSIISIMVALAVVGTSSANDFSDDFNDKTLDTNFYWSVISGNPTVSEGLLNFTNSGIVSKQFFYSGVLTFVGVNFNYNTYLSIQQQGGSGIYYTIRNDISSLGFNVVAKSSYGGNVVLFENNNPQNVICQIDFSNKNNDGNVWFRAKYVGDSGWIVEKTLAMGASVPMQISISNGGGPVTIDSVNLTLDSNIDETKLITPPPFWSCPKIDASPIIDGKINLSEWQSASLATGFQLHPDSGLGWAKNQTHVWFAWDSEFMYVAFRSNLEYIDPTLLPHCGRDTEAYLDESYEFHIYPVPGQTQPRYQFVISRCAMWDAKDGQPSWNAPGMHYSMMQHSGFFDVEMAVPWSNMNVTPSSGTQMRAVFVRNNFGEKQNSALNKTEGLFSDYEKAAVIELTDNEPFVKLEQFGELLLGLYEPKFELINPTEQKQKLEYRIGLCKDINSQYAFESLVQSVVELAPGESLKVANHSQVFNPELRIAKFEVVNNETKKSFVSFSAPFECKQEIGVDLQSRPSQNSLDVNVDIRRVLSTQENLHYDVEVKNVSDETILKKTLTSLPNGLGKASFRISQIPIGIYTVDVLCKSDSNEIVSKWSGKWERLNEKPEWMTNPVGVERRVSKPFIPVKKTQNGSNIGIETLGRRYEYEKSLLPTSIFTQEKQILVSPMELAVRVNGAMQKNPVSSLKILEQCEDKVVLSSFSKLPGFSIRAITSVEFDGLALVNLEFLPDSRSSRNLSIDEITLSIPIQSECASLMYANRNAYETPQEINTGFTSVVWLGNEELGLCWFAENPTNWKMVNSANTISVKSEGETTKLVIRLVDGSINLDKKLDFKFGLMATPVKPLPKNWMCWYWFNNNGPLDSLGFKPEPYDTVLYMPAWDESVQYLHEAIPLDWYKNKINESHTRGMKGMYYSQTNNLSFYGNEAPDWWKQMALSLGIDKAEVKNTPEKLFWGLDWKITPGNTWASMCVKTGWKDLLCKGLEERIVKGGAEAFYFDCSPPESCSNTEHGCNGGVGILAQRDIRRRLRNLFEKNNVDGVIWENTQGLMNVPLFGFDDVYYNGEESYWKINDDMRPITTLGWFRTLFSVKNFGVIPMLLMPIESGRSPEVITKASNSLTAMLAIHYPVHCIPIWGSGPIIPKAMALDVEFRFTPETVRVGYWEKSELYSVSPSNTLVTLYHKPGKILLVASNLSDQQVSSTIVLNTNKIDFPPETLTVMRWMDNQDSPPVLVNNQIQCSIRPNSCMMMILTQKE